LSSILQLWSNALSELNENKTLTSPYYPVGGELQMLLITADIAEY
jgi:hypothetical protein